MSLVLKILEANAVDDPAFMKLSADVEDQLYKIGLKTNRSTDNFGGWIVHGYTSSRNNSTPGNKEGSGVYIKIYKGDDQWSNVLEFYEINSITPGFGSKMVDAAIAAINKSSRNRNLIKKLRIHHDWSPQDGGQSWWQKMASKYSQFEWKFA